MSKQIIVWLTFTDSAAIDHKHSHTRSASKCNARESLTWSIEKQINCHTERLRQVYARAAAAGRAKDSDERIMEAYLACTEEKMFKRENYRRRDTAMVFKVEKNSPTKSINALFVYYLSNSDSVTEFLRMSHAFSHFFTRLHVDCRVASASAVFRRQSRRVVVIETEIPWAFDFTTCSVYLS